MIVTLEEMKQYLRVDFDDDDSLIETLITSAKVIWQCNHKRQTKL